MPLTKATQAVIAPNICTTDTAQTITGEKTFTQAIIADITGDVTATSVSTTNLVNGSSLCFRNKIINGNFDIWQRGTSLGSGTGARYLADRFVNASVVSTYTVSQQSFSNGQADVPNNPSYFHRTVVSSVAGNGNYANFATTIESVKNLAGKTATLSFYAKADSSKSISIEFIQEFGTGGSPSSQVTGIGVQKLNLTSSWQKFTVTANIPSIAGKTIGTNNNDYLAVAFWFDAGSDYNSRTNSLGQQSGTFDIAQVQLEEGSVATPFELRTIGTELALCQRYYEKSYNIDVVPSAVTSVGQAFGSRQNGAGVAYVKFSTTKRATPAVNIWSLTGGSGQVRNTATVADEIGTVQDASQSGFNVFPTTSTISQAYTFQWVAQSEL
jgi:hypothetical protein